MVKKNKYFTRFTFFLLFYLTSLRGKEAGAARIKIPRAGAGAAWEKKSGAGAGAT